MFKRFVRSSWIRVILFSGAFALNFFIAPSAFAVEPIRLAMIEGLSGNFANAGEAAYRNLLLAVERVNARGGVHLPGGARPLELLRMDSKGNAEETLSMLQSALDQHV